MVNSNVVLAREGDDPVYQNHVNRELFSTLDVMAEFPRAYDDLLTPAEKRHLLTLLAWRAW